MSDDRVVCGGQEMTGDTQVCNETGRRNAPSPQAFGRQPPGFGPPPR
ncbi:MAG: hypothetical protein ACRDQB_13920 [Thermocrispum sp.]